MLPLRDPHWCHYKIYVVGWYGNENKTTKAQQQKQVHHFDEGTVDINHCQEVKFSFSVSQSVSQSVNKLSLHVQMLTINYQFEKNKIKIIMSFNDDTSPVGVTWAWCCYRWLLLVVVVSLVTEEFRNHSVTNGCFYFFFFFVSSLLVTILSCLQT